MKINLTRRDVLKFGAGAVAGVMVTPAPWKAIDDLAIWTQNWKWIPVPPKGPVSMKPTTCSLCPAGCAVRARCIGGQPVSMLPASRAAGETLCPLGLTGHHLPYHPARITAPARVLRGRGAGRRVPVTIETVVAEMKNAAAGGPVAVLDTRPGRSMSAAWRVWLASLPGGTYLPDPAREGAGTSTLEQMTGRAPGSIALDLASAATIVSFGAPLAEGWGDPRVTRRILRRDESSPMLVQVEPLHSPTAQAADRWLPVIPGTEAAMALALAHVLIARDVIDPAARTAITDFDDYAALAASFAPEAAARITGVPAHEIEATALQIAQRRPVLVVAGELPGGGRMDRASETAVLGLNLLLGSGAEHAGVVERAEAPDGFETAVPRAAPADLDQIADRSLSLLIVDAAEGDAAVPWRVVERKLGRGAVVVALTPFSTGIAGHADYLIPIAPFTEGLHEVTEGFDSAQASLALATALIQPRAKASDPAEILAALGAAGATTTEDLVKARIAQIHASGAGTVVNPADGSAKPVTEFGSPDEMWEALSAGQRWNGPTGGPLKLSGASLLSGVRAQLAAMSGANVQIAEAKRPLVLLPRGTRDATASAAVSPVMTKIYQESGLRRQAGTIVLNPKTARQLSMSPGASVRLETAAGALLATLAVDEQVMPGVIEAPVGPDAAALGDGRPSGGTSLRDILPASASWRAAAASVVEG